MKIVFFGSSEFSVLVLEELKSKGILPELIITTPDKPKGRKLVLTPTEVKVWAEEHHIEVFNPPSLKNNLDLISNLKSKNYDLFLVASYGKIIPKEVFEIPNKKTLNIHPSLLPKYRGASPIQFQILNDEKEVGVSIMQIEETMDTGPIIVQKKVKLDSILGRKELEKLLAIEGARLFSHILPEYEMGTIRPIIQNHDKATYCPKIKKEDGLLDMRDSPRQNLLKIKAFEDWPTAYFFEDGKRLIVTEATIEEDKLKILRLKPEGKKEMSYMDYERGKNRLATSS